MPSPVAMPVVLESGDNLSRMEFHRRFCARPDIKNAELVTGYRVARCGERGEQRFEVRGAQTIGSLVRGPTSSMKNASITYGSSNGSIPGCQPWGYLALSLLANSSSAARSASISALFA